MDRLYTDSWYLVRALAGLPSALSDVAPTVPVVQPTHVVRKYIRRVRKWVNFPSPLWPGYAFVKGPFPPFSLSRCSAFKGFVHTDEGRKVCIGGKELQEIIDNRTTPEDALREGTTLKFADAHMMAGKEVTVRSIQNRGDREIVLAEVQTDLGFKFQISEGLEKFQPA